MPIPSTAPSWGYGRALLLANLPSRTDDRVAKRAGHEVQARPRSRYRRSSFAAPVRALGPPGLQPATKTRVSGLGLLDPAALLVALAFQVVGVCRSLLAAGRLMTGPELEIAQLSGMQGGTGPEIALVLGQQMPDQDGELARRCDGRDMLSPPGLHAQKEAAQRTWGARCRPGGLDQHAAGMTAALLGDPPMISGARPGLPHARVQPEIANELLGFGKARDFADRGNQRECYNHVDAGDGHQPLDPVVRQCR